MPDITPGEKAAGKIGQALGILLVVGIVYYAFKHPLKFIMYLVLAIVVGVILLAVFAPKTGTKPDASAGYELTRNPYPGSGGGR